jgi:hypothetical protein
VVSFGNALPLRQREGLSLWYWDFPEDTDPVIASMSEPYGSRHWWPCKDRQRPTRPDSPGVRDHRAPAGLTAVSNGTLRGSRSTTATARSPSVWRDATTPSRTYLVSVAI